MRIAADRVTALRNGQLAGTLESESLTEAEAVKLILGRKIERVEEVARTAAEGVPVLRAQGAVARRRTMAALERAVEPYRGSGGGLELPVAAKLASGAKR